MCLIFTGSMLPGFDLPGTCLSTSESTTRFLWACLFYFWRQGLSIHSCGCPETCSVEKADLKLTEIHFSTSRVLGLKACSTTARLMILFLKRFYFKLCLCFCVEECPNEHGCLRRPGENVRSPGTQRCSKPPD